VLERSFPIRIIDKTFLPGSGGDGKFRGGLGERIALEVTSERPVSLVVLSQRMNFPPLGRQGGKNGSVGRILLNDEPVQGDRAFHMHKGDVIVLELPGGGGFGSAAERASHLGEADIKDGMV
jgi:N-methylhydantoinase B